VLITYATGGSHSMGIIFSSVCELCLSVSVSISLQCFDAVGWAAGRASGL